MTRILAALHAILLFLGFAVASAMGASGAGSASMPDVLYVSQVTHEYARWYSVDAMLDENGNLNDEYIHPLSQESIQSLLSIPPEDGCIRLQEFYSSNVGERDRSTLRKTVQNSDLVVHGKVTGQAFGFKGSTPGQLFRLEPIEVIKGADEYLDEYYFFFPVGTFALGDQVICKTDRRYPDVPDVGDEVVLSLPYRTDPTEAFLETDLWGAEGYITLKPGKVSLPSLFLRHGGQVPPTAELLRQIQELAHGGGE